MREKWQSRTSTLLSYFAAKPTKIELRVTPDAATSGDEWLSCYMTSATDKGLTVQEELT